MELKDSKQLSLDLDGRRHNEAVPNDSTPVPERATVHVFVSVHQRNLLNDVRSRLSQSGVFRPLVG
jgi:hypothetical protein